MFSYLGYLCELGHSSLVSSYLEVWRAVYSFLFKMRVRCVDYERQPTRFLKSPKYRLYELEISRKLACGSVVPLKDVMNRPLFFFM